MSRRGPSAIPCPCRAASRFPVAGTNLPALPNPKGGIPLLIASNWPGDITYFSCQIPGSPTLSFIRLLKLVHAGQCVLSWLQAYASRSSKDFHNCPVAFPVKPLCPRKSELGSASNSLIVLGIARKVGSHLCTFHHFLIRMPIKKITNSLSISTVSRSLDTSAKVAPSSFG